MKKRLVVVSIDAMNKKDFELIKDKEPFKTFIEEGAYCDNVKSVFPSLTYPAHASIMTACYPDKHGIINNFKNDESKIVNPDAYWFKKDFKVKTLFDYLEERGFKNSTFFYPTMAGEKRGFVLPEIWSTGKKNNKAVIKKNIARKMLFPVMNASKELSEKNKQENDNFVFEVCKTIVRKKSPDTVFLHLSELGIKRRTLGFSGEHVEVAYDSICKKLIELQNLLKKDSKYDNSHMVILGDHGGENALNDIKLNVFFKENDLLFEEKGKILKESHCYSNSSGGSAHVFVKDKKSISIVFELLLYLRDRGIIAEVYTKAEARQKFSISGDFDFVVEAAENHQFVNDIHGQLVEEYTVETKLDNRFCGGQIPQKEQLKTMFFMKGPKVKKNYYIDLCNLVDEGATLAKLLDFNMPSVDGRVLEEALK